MRSPFELRLATAYCSKLRGANSGPIMNVAPLNRKACAA